MELISKVIGAELDPWNHIRVSPAITQNPRKLATSIKQDRYWPG
jgi:hypothetical protein